MASIGEFAGKAAETAGEAISKAKPVVEGAVAAGAKAAAGLAKSADEWASGEHPIMEGAYETVGKAGEGILGAVSGAANAAYDFLNDRVEDVSGMDLNDDGVVGGSGKPEGEVKAGAQVAAEAAAGAIGAAAGAVGTAAGAMAGAVKTFFMGDEQVEATGAMLGEPWVSSNLQYNLSPDFNPGPEEDFYVYVNRDFLMSNEMPAGDLENIPLMFGAMRMVQDQCAELLLGPNSEESDIRSTQNYYKLMLDWEGRDKAGIAPLDEELARIDAISTIEELNELLCDPDPLRRFDLLETDVDQDPIDGSSYTAVAVMHVLTMHKDSAEYTEPTPTGQIGLKSKRETYDFIAKKTCIADKADAIWEAALAYQTEMAPLFPTEADQAEAGFWTEVGKKRANRAELISALGAFPTERVLDAHGYGDVDEFCIPFDKFNANVAACYDEAHLDGIKSSLMASLVFDSASYLTSEIYDETARIYSENMGGELKNDDEDKRRKAFDKVFEALPASTSKLYISRYANEEMKAEIREMCDNIVSVYKKMMATEDWLSEKTRNYAIEKLDAMKFRVLYPEKWTDYSALDIRSAEEGETLWSARLKVGAFVAKIKRALAGQPYDSDLMDKCIETNCNYNPADNSVNIYLGFISDVTYRNDMTLEEKMGGLGVVIGHEISHGFDVNGRLYDKFGVANDWWTEEDSAAFDARAKRAMDWYETVYKPKGELMPGIGKRSVGETFADLGSLSVAMTLAKEIEGFDYDKFFRAFGRVWSRIDTEYAFDYMLLTDEHPMGNLRINLTLAQLPKFHETYGVKEGDKMYFAPEDRLGLW
jgi:putative endopeptidase